MTDNIRAVRRYRRKRRRYQPPSPPSSLQLSASLSLQPAKPSAQPTSTPARLRPPPCPAYKHIPLIDFPLTPSRRRVSAHLDAQTTAGLITSIMASQWLPVPIRFWPTSTSTSTCCTFPLCSLQDVLPSCPQLVPPPPHSPGGLNVHCGLHSHL